MDQAVIARRLKHARTASGLSQDEVAERLGLSRPAVSLIEAGKRAVSSVELAKLSRLYQLPAAAFLEEPGGEGVLERFRAGNLEEGDREILDQALQYFRYYALLEHAAYGGQRYDLPLYPARAGLAIEQGTHLAEQERGRLGLGNGPVRSMIQVLEQEGVKVTTLRFPDESSLSGCFFFSDDLGPCIVINESHPPQRRRFTAAHEYAHAVSERQEGIVCVSERRRELDEMRANAFAAAFLLPETGIGEALAEMQVARGEIKAEHVVRVMHTFGASYEAVLWRLLNFKWISKSEREQLSTVPPEGLSRTLGYSSLPGENEPEPERFKSVAIQAWRQGEISTGKLAELLNVSKQEIREQLEHDDRSLRKPRRATTAEPDWF